MDIDEIWFIIFNEAAWASGLNEIDEFYSASVISIDSPFVVNLNL
jgi:hypothetical protein